MPLPPSKVLIIGAGVAGLISYRNLSTFGKFESVVLYERRDNIGGVWYLDDPGVSKQCTDIEYLPKTSTSPRWPSVAYPGLIGNVLPEYLSFSQFPFPPRADVHQPFPTLQETHEYLREFAEPHIQQGKKVRLNMEVIHVEELPHGQGWKVSTRDWNEGKAGEQIEEIWDAVVVAVGWCDHPVWPVTPGLDILRERGLAVHAKWYRGPEGNEGKCALVVGNANSGNDIAAHLAPIAQSPVYQSIRRPAFPGFPSLPDDRIHMVAPVEKYQLFSPGDGAPDKITAHLTDGTTLEDIDIVHVATGYKPNPDFVHVFDPSSSSSSVGGEPTKPKLMKLVDQNPYPPAGPRVPSLHRHILYAYNPTLAFMGSPMSFTPFTINDMSSLWLTYTWANEIPLPQSPGALLEFEKNRMESIEKWRSETENPSALYAYGVLGYSEEDYAEELRKEVVEVHPEFDERLPRWAPAEERREYRGKMYPLKYVALAYARDHQTV